ncbi:Selenide, water dikinase [Entophlyctis helioformis]|nr:Selenide, water dikinase [Entophlyctis helioformis]
MDSSITPTRFPGIKLVQTTDFFYPVIEDPYVQGMITCANVLSDLFAMGVPTCDNMLMLLTLPRDMPESDRLCSARMTIQGFHDAAAKAGTRVTGGQTVRGPWFMTGGVASTVASEKDLLALDAAQPGDVLVLTKPLGTQVAINVQTWLWDESKFARIAHLMTRDEAKQAFDTATLSMVRLNQTAARLMVKYGAHAATDVTGFGIIGHAQNLVSRQLSPVDFCITALPVIDRMDQVDAIVSYKLSQGLSAETSGGLLVALAPDAVRPFLDEIQQQDGWPAHIVGHVEQGQRRAVLKDAEWIRCPWQTSSQQVDGC